MKNTKVRNQLELWLFCAIIGAFAGGLVWALLKVLAVGTESGQVFNSVLYDCCVYDRSGNYRAFP